MRHGRRDPSEPGGDNLPEAKRLVQAYPGVVAWYCGLKHELYATCVVDYNDVFGVYEWGARGIVHLHCLAWSEGYGRYDAIDGQPPSDGTRGQALRLARRHDQVLAEWNMRKA